jgi:hypothetical protein
VITEADIASAERLLGIVYTARERAQMVGNLDGQIASATARRKVRLANSMPMASRFDPRLPTFRVPALAGPLIREGAPLFGLRKGANPDRSSGAARVRCPSRAARKSGIHLDYPSPPSGPNGRR